MDSEHSLQSRVTNCSGTSYCPTESFYLAWFRSVSLEREHSYFLGQALLEGNGQSYYSSDSINETDRGHGPLSSDFVLTNSSEGGQEQGPQSWNLPLSVFYLREGGRVQQTCTNEARESSLPHTPLEPPQPVLYSRAVCKYLNLALGQRKLMQEG